MFKHLSIVMFLHLSLYLNKVTSSPISSYDWVDFLKSKDPDITSQPIFDTEDSSSTTSQSAFFDPSSDRKPDASLTASLPSSTEILEHQKGTDTIDWKFAFLVFSMMILVLTFCKCCTRCIPNLCEMCLDNADAMTVPQREREITGPITTPTTAENRFKSRRTPQQTQPYANHFEELTVVLQLEQISGAALPQNLPSQIMSFQMDNEAFTDDSDQDISMNERSQNCETPPPPYSAVMSDADVDIDNSHEMNAVD